MPLRLASHRIGFALFLTLGVGISSSAQSSITWQALGPAPIATNGLGLPGVNWFPSSGRVSAIAFHPIDPNIIYLGAGTGGVWKTKDGGITWTPLTDQQCSLLTSSIAIDPVNPNIVYVGTGDFEGGGCGVLRSSDGGNTWVQTGSIGSAYDPTFKILIQPSTAGSTTSTTILVAAFDGIYRSTNSGSTYTRVLAGTGAIKDLVMTPGNPQMLYASSSAEGGGVSSLIYKSGDGGATWKASSSGLPAPSGYIEVSLAVSPSSPSTLITALGGSANSPDIFKSLDAGATWSKVTPTGDPLDCQCFYDVVVAFDPSDANVIYFGGINLFKSADGGLSWKYIDQNATVHGDYHVLIFNSGRLYVGNDGGISSTIDGGSHWTSLNADLATTQFYYLSTHPTDPNILFGGTQDNGALKYTGSPGWTEMCCGDVFFTAIGSSPETYYADDLGFFERLDGGATYFRIRMNGIEESRCGTFAMSPVDSHTCCAEPPRRYTERPIEGTIGPP